MRKPKNDIVVLFDSDEAAQLKTVTGWVSREGWFHGNDERAARYAGCTHQICECGKQMERHYTKCADCRHKADVERYNALPFKEWDGETPLYSKSADRYFFDEESLIDYCNDDEDETVTPDDLMLVVCKPNEYSQIDGSYWESVLPEDGELPDEISDALKKLNEVIDKLPPGSWSPGRFRTSYTLI